MAKYSDEFKLMVVKEYLSGPLGFKLLVRKYGIKSHTQLQNWVNIYKAHGEAGLYRKINKQVYSVQFKLDVLNFMKRTGASRADTADHFGLTNPPMISSWNKKFLEGGIEALDRPGGRPAMSNKKTNKNHTSKQPKTKKMTREQELEHENELLRLEVAYLKKLKAFQANPEGYLEKHKQRYHSNSRKNLD